jgi:hypothetical protein
MTVLFFVWWAGSARGGWAVGALLFVLGALGHLSATIVLVVLAGALALVSWQDCGERGWRRLLALAVGLGLTALYYGHFVGLVVEQLPRLAEGAGRGASQPWSDVLCLQLKWIAWVWWGFPAVLLALLGLPRPGQGRLDRSLVAFWLGGGVLFVAGLVSPVEVRYLYALTLPLAFAVASGYAWLASKGQALRALGLMAVLGQVALVVGTMIERIFMHYR